MSSTDLGSAIDIARVILGMVFLSYASYTDLKIRKVKNEVWLIMGACGCALLAVQLLMEERRWEYFLILIPVATLFFSMFIDFGSSSEKGKTKINFIPIVLYVIGLLVIIFQFNALSNETLFYKLLTIPVLILFFYVLYQLGMLHGGADAKAMMAIAIFVPFYPHFLGFPILQFSPERVASSMELFFPFAFLVLMNSVFFVIWALFAFLIYNGAKGEIEFPEMLLGYKMDIEEVTKKHVWSMEKVVDDERVRVLFPRKNDEESLEKLRELGVKKVWVTPKIPFIVFITCGFIISALIGNLFVAFIGLIS